jgi:hypothetical protein
MYINVVFFINITPFTILYYYTSILVEYRRVARKNRLLKQANFDVVKTFQGYTFDHIEIPKQLSVEELKSTKFIERKENLFYMEV